MSLLLTGAGGFDAAAVGGSAFTFQGTQYLAGTPPAGLAVTFAITTGSVAAGALVVASFGVSNLAGATITSVVYDPGGANVTLTQDAFHNANHVCGVYSGTVAGTISSGSKNIVVTLSTSAQFQDAGMYLWTMTGLGSNLKQTGAGGATNVTLGVTAGHYMVGVNVNGGGGAVDYGLSTEVPTTIHAAADVIGPEWNTIISTNASFVASPSRAGSSVGGDIAVATYH